MGRFVAQPAAVAEGVVDVSVNKYPVTPTLSVAVKVVIDIVSEFEVAGIEKAVTVGGVVSVLLTGLLLGSPGNVLALISAIFVKPSPSES